jgi:uncharacterized protein (TIGR02757 family)
MSLKQKLDILYRTYNRMEYLHPDPLEFLHRYEDSADREIVGLIAACLAYGRVKQILSSVSSVLKTMGPSPARYITQFSRRRFTGDFSGFRHRFAAGSHMVALLTGIKQILSQYGALDRCFLAGYDDGDENILPALTAFVRVLTDGGNRAPGHLISLPERGSACKRLNLYLRWMIRKDAVDPGGWDSIPAAKLIIPLDVHMHRVGLGLGFTARKQADIKTAHEITNGFKKIAPKDPVRYDFALTRLGIRSDENLAGFLKDCYPVIHV